MHILEKVPSIYLCHYLISLYFLLQKDGLNPNGEDTRAADMPEIEPEPMAQFTSCTALRLQHQPTLDCSLCFKWLSIIQRVRGEELQRVCFAVSSASEFKRVLEHAP